MLELFSPAKLNLTFEVLYKRSDGFHQIASLFQAISLGDRITFEEAERDQLNTNDSTLPLDRTNLIWKAVDLFRKKTAIATPLSIHLDKEIPTEAGLGGGSSNAATTLYAMNQLFNAGQSDTTLAEWGSEIGSDVPFFFTTGRARCTGRGEICTSLPHEEMTLWIAKPAEGLSTPAVYGAHQISPAHKQKGPYSNDLEKAAFTLCPKLKELQQALLAMGFEEVHMTGSGTAFFCIGSALPTAIEGVSFFETQFTHRSSRDWYKFPKSSIVTLH